MLRALYLAQKGIGSVAPNPMVGAVLVYNDIIIGEGWHQQFGQVHAEVNCINNVAEINKDKITQSTLYVTLEPCSHHGKTPPCADLIIQSKIPKVVIACVDTFSKVAGKGIEKLQLAGIEVEVGVLENEARFLNRRFFTFYEKNRPYTLLKWAQSADGFIAPPNGQKVMLSNALAGQYVQQMRHDEAAILVGYQTALLDNPMLTNRYGTGKNPLRIVIDFENSLPENIHLKTDGNQTVIFNKYLEQSIDNCQYVLLNEEHDYPSQVLNYLFKIGINSLIVEGGSKTLQSFIDKGLWDEAHVINTPIKLEDGVRAPQLSNWQHQNKLALGDNTNHIYNSNSNKFYQS